MLFHVRLYTFNQSAFKGWPPIATRYCNKPWCWNWAFKELMFCFVFLSARTNNKLFKEVTLIGAFHWKLPDNTAVIYIENIVQLHVLIRIRQPFESFASLIYEAFTAGSTSGQFNMNQGFNTLYAILFWTSVFKLNWNWTK